jgi:hypothetical protein
VRTPVWYEVITHTAGIGIFFITRSRHLFELLTPGQRPWARARSGGRAPSLAGSRSFNADRQVFVFLGNVQQVVPKPTDRFAFCHVAELRRPLA